MVPAGRTPILIPIPAPLDWKDPSNREERTTNHLFLNDIFKTSGKWTWYVCNFLIYWNSTMTISTILHYFWHFNSLNYVWSSLFEMTSGPLQKEARSNSIWITCRLHCLLPQKTALKTFRQQNPAIKPKKRLQSNIRILYASLWSFTSRRQTIEHSLKCLVHGLTF